jgi:general secretion pathway protein G
MLLATIRSARQKAARRAGFTLLEVLVVVAILVILASVAIVATTRYLEDAKKSKAQLQAKALATAIEAYMLHPHNSGNQPPQDDDWTALHTPGFGTSFLKNGEEDIIDPWNGRFRFASTVGEDGGIAIVVYTYSGNDRTPISNFGMADKSRVPQS